MKEKTSFIILSTHTPPLLHPWLPPSNHPYFSRINGDMFTRDHWTRRGIKFLLNEQHAEWPQASIFSLCMSVPFAIKGEPWNNDFHGSFQLWHLEDLQKFFQDIRRVPFKHLATLEGLCIYIVFHLLNRQINLTWVSPKRTQDRIANVCLWWWRSSNLSIDSRKPLGVSQSNVRL